MLKDSAKKTLIIGPSHCVRMAHAIASNQIPSRTDLLVFGKGGLPVWHKDIITYDFSSFHDVFILVGDFRFGNEIAVSSVSDFEKILRVPLGYRNVRKGNISIQNDLFMYGLSVYAIKRILKKNKNIKLVFWDLLGREFFNRQLGKYTLDGDYNHPVWNLSDVEKIFSDRVVSLSSLNSTNNCNTRP